MAITRRQFLKYAAASAAALGLSELELFQLTQKVMADLPNGNRPVVVALQGQCCNGDLTSLANLMNSIPADTVAALKPGQGWQHTVRAAYGQAVEELLGVDAAFGASPTTTVDDVLIDLVNLQFHPTISAPAGALAFNNSVWDVPADNPGGYIMLVEGSVPVAGTLNTFPTVGVDACTIGDTADTLTTRAPKTMFTALQHLCADSGAACAAVIAVGTCAAYGGIPAAKNGNEKYASGANKGQSKYKSTHAVSVQAALDKMTAAPGVTKPPVVNVTGCPIRPDDLFLSIAAVILGGLNGLTGVGGSNLTADGRPKSVLGINIHGQTQHFNCSRKAAYAAGNMATSFADTDGKCLATLGCRGQTTYASCQRSKKHQWNAMTPVPADIPTGFAGTPIHDTSSTVNWPGLTAVPAYGGVLGTVSNEGGSSCIKKGHPCIGCKEKGFPDRFSPLVKYNN